MAFKVLSSVSKANIGGTTDTVRMMVILANIAVFFPPISVIFLDFPKYVGLQLGADSPKVSYVIAGILQLGLLLPGVYCAYKIFSDALSNERRKFALHSTCATESSDPPVTEQEINTGKYPGLLFGYCTDTGDKLFIKDEDLVRHSIIVGQTGMGKSVFGKALMFQQIQRGGGLLFVDGKLDSDNIQDIYEFACYCGRASDFLVVNPGQPERSNTYNPILFGDPDEVAARIISLIPSTAASAGADYYKQSANLALVCFISALQEESLEERDAREQENIEAGRDPGFIDRSRVRGQAYNFMDLALLTMNEGVLNQLMSRIQSAAKDSLTAKNLAVFLEQYAKENNGHGEVGANDIDLKRLKETLGGIGARMHQFGSGNFGPVLNDYNPEVKMYECIKDNKIVYVALPTMGKDVAAQNLGKIVIADLRTSISWLQLNKEDRPKIPFLAFMDEMSSYSTDTLAVMFEQARSARVALMPAIQTDSGLSNISEDFKERIMANTEMKIFFRLSSQDTAMTASDLIGETKRITFSETASQSSSLSAQALQLGPNKNMAAGSSSALGEREQAEPLVSPDQIKALDPGECIILRSPRVWNIRVPMIELSQATKKAIGPLRINHINPLRYVEPAGTFNSLGSVDQHIKNAQNKRSSSKKKDKDAGAAASKPNPAHSGLDAADLAEKEYAKDRAQEGGAPTQAKNTNQDADQGISNDMPDD